MAAEQRNVDSLEAREAFKTIRAPFDGTVTARNTDMGAYVPAGSGTPLFFAWRRLRGCRNRPCPLRSGRPLPPASWRTATWPYLFAINIPFGIGAVVIGMRALPIPRATAMPSTGKARR